MNKLLLLGSSIFFILTSYAFSGKAYMERFEQYRNLSTQLPEEASTELVHFLSTDSPLAKKLRSKWLYKLADDKNWAIYNQFYKYSKDVSLQCYALIAQYHEGEKKQALKKAESLWLVGRSQPKACDALFSLLTHDKNFDEELITKRIILALEQRNLPLARYLLKQYKSPRTEDAKSLLRIYRNPSRINMLKIGELHDDFYLYGLKRMVSRNMDKAIQYWQHVRTKKLLSERQQQAFLAHISLYKAMRDHKDSYEWFKKIKPTYYSEVLLDWQIRFALKHHQWRKVQKFIKQFKNQDDPCWQYWLARSLEEQGKKQQAKMLYKQLAPSRHYYGFLASVKLKKNFQFENEYPKSDLSMLKPYSQLLQEIKELYKEGQLFQASRLLNDFSSELPKDEVSALAYWVSNELDWPGKSVYLSTVHDGLNDQLALRFPLSHRETVTNYAKNYTIQPEFIYAIIRQESGFRSKVVSSAGARGLMQIMPDTAKLVARKEKISYKNHRQLFELKKNINIGVAYLQQLSRRFNSHPVLMAAAYNAGPEQVNYWLKNHPPKQVDIWIETLPWYETRNYLKNVIAFYAVYQYRMHKKPDLKWFMKTI